MCNELSKRLAAQRLAIEQGKEIALEQVDVNPEIERYKKSKNKHKVEEQIKQLHLTGGGLLKHEMEEKLRELDALDEALTKPDKEIITELGLLQGQQVRTSTLKERIHEDPEELARKRKEAA